MQDILNLDRFPLHKPHSPQWQALVDRCRADLAAQGMFNPEGLNWWTVVSGMGMNFVLTSMFFIALIAFTGGASTGEEGAPPTSGLPPALYTLAMSIGAFLIPLLTAYVCGRVSGERYMTYAFYPLIGYMILAVPGVLYAGVFGLLLVLFGVLGAFNGATLAARRGARRRHSITKSD